MTAFLKILPIVPHPAILIIRYPSTAVSTALHYRPAIRGEPR
ncbi:hypothetical protein BACPEC_02427 [[Bacteroides] pectinophilus ATCC 43243]|uniref:Uncharacterized protein n=1 Tax=[Bacteroides] pectinophilus ATCC 43243 TaxID=483218 RepID=B7AUM8_9FIRM|nr:hypothetical protein BACPEC_02427 [[Bacteroides] pectinophilus ATCC 43243]